MQRRRDHEKFYHVQKTKILNILKNISLIRYIATEWDTQVSADSCQKRNKLC